MTFWSYFSVHIVIGPVENITAYLIQGTSIVLTWDPPPVYLVHDVNASLEELSVEQELTLSKHQNGAAVDVSGIANGTGLLGHRGEGPSIHDVKENGK